MKTGYDPAIAMNFAWFEDGRVAACRGPRTERELSFLVSTGIRALVRLAHEEETGISSAEVLAGGLVDCYEPVKDWTAPSQHQIDRVISFMNDSLESGKPVAVSCGAGYGRTGTILACYLVSHGNSAEAAIQQLIEKRPCSREILSVPGQRDAIYEFQRRKDLGS